MSAPTTAYAQACTNCGFAFFTPNPNILAPKALGLATRLPSVPTTCPHCGSAVLTPITVTLP